MILIMLGNRKGIGPIWVLYLFCWFKNILRNKVKKSVDLWPTFCPFSKMPILRGLSGVRENRLTDFLECYILCFETTYRVNRINTVVVLYLWGIETWITFSFFILHLICGSVPLRNISHKNFWVFFCDAQLRKLCIRISIFIDGLKKRVPLCRWQRELLFYYSNCINSHQKWFIKLCRCLSRDDVVMFISKT